MQDTTHQFNKLNGQVSSNHMSTVFEKLTLKKAAVLPPFKAPYLILVCLARSSALSIGESILSTVRKAARFAVYEEIIIRVKNHHIPATIRVDIALQILYSSGYKMCHL